MKKAIAIIVLGLLWNNIVFADSKKPIIIPIHSWRSQEVMAYVIGGIFEEVGSNVEYVTVDSQAVYESIRRGDVSISHEVWQSAFGRSFDTARNKGGLLDWGDHAARTIEEVGVPTWVIEKNLCPGLPDWKALKKCAHVFARAGSNGKGVILDGPKIWNQDLFPQRIQALGLADKYVVKFAGGKDALWRELADAKREGRGTMIFNWSPNFTDMEGFTMIKWPPYRDGCRPTDGGDGACGSPDGYLKKAVSVKFTQTHPDAARAFKKIAFTTKDIGRMAAYVDIEKMTHEQAAKKWLRKNKHKWEHWIGRTNLAYNAFEQQVLDEDSFYKATTAKKQEKDATIEQMYVDGLLTKDECIKAKKKILKNQTILGCKIAETKEEEKKVVKKEFTQDQESIDNDPPKIEIAESITVNDTDYEVEGKVKDKSEKIFIEVMGRPVKVHKGKFVIRRYSPVDEQISIVAIDQWGNISKPKIVNIKIDIKDK